MSESYNKIFRPRIKALFTWLIKTRETADRVSNMQIYHRQILFKQKTKQLKVQTVSVLVCKT